MSSGSLLGLCGSLRSGSLNAKLMREAARIFEPLNFVEGDLRLPLYDGDLEADGLQMTINELSTARQYDADITVIVANNGRYGTIRMHQELHYPDRTSGTDLFNPDYATLAKAYGGTGHVVERFDQFPVAFAAAREGGLHIIELRLDPNMLSTTRNLST